MGGRKVIVSQTAAYAIAHAADFIESRGLTETAIKFSDSVYEFLEKLSSRVASYSSCREPSRGSLGFKCVQFKKYTIVFLEFEEELVVCEFLPSKMITW
jgi:hypothetical protein